MKLSCLPVSIFSEICSGEIKLNEWSNFAAKIGLDAFDISILFIRDRTPTGLKNARKEIDAGGIPLGMIATYPDFATPDDEFRSKELHRSLGDIATAADLGAEYVRITAGQYYPGQDNIKSLEGIVRCLYICSEAAQKYGIKLLWENHSKPGAWENIDFNYDVERLEMMHHELEDGPVLMNYDIANACLLGFGVELFEKYYNQIATIHVNDVKSVSPIKFCGIGNGIAKVQETLELAKNRGFNGMVSVEEASFEGWAGISKYVAETRSYIENSK